MATETVAVPAATVGVVALIAQWYTPEFGTSAAMVLTALFSGLAVLYAARTARIVAIREIAIAVAPVEAKVTAMEPVVQRIDTHVNGDKTQAKNELAIRDQQIELQKQTIVTMERAAALLAQALAAREMSSAVAQAAIAGAASPGAVVP